MADIVDLYVLKDGRIKMETSKIGNANHMRAEKLLRELTLLAGGGDTEIKPKVREGQSHHSHDDHEHHHHHDEQHT